jgi:hypothetical protein
MPASATSKEVEDKFPLLFADDTPNVEEQFKEFQRAGGVSVVAVQRDRNERIRYNRWKGRTSDFRKHRRAIGKEAVPWENAWDGRVHLADNVIEDLGDVCSSAFERAQLKVKPTEVGDLDQAGITEKIINKYRDRMRADLRDEAEYLWQFGLNGGSSVFQVGWDYELAMKNQRVNLEEFLQAAQMAQQALSAMPAAEVPPEMVEKMQQFAILPQLIMDPEMVDAAVDILRMFARDIAGQLYAEQREEYGSDFLRDYELSASKARHVIGELRKRGHARLPVPYVAKNQPCVTAREVGYDYFCPPEMNGCQDSPWHAVREWLPPEDVYARVLSDGWDPDWAEEAIKTAGQTSYWGDVAAISDTTSFDSDDEVDTYDWQAQKSENGLIEVVHFYKRYITQERVREIWCTVWCPHVMTDPMNPTEPLYAKHYQYEDLPDKYPFCGFRWQKKKRAFMNAQGIPQIVGSDQWAIKTSIDMLMDLEQATVSPEWLVDQRLGLRFKVGPGAQIPRRRAGDVEKQQAPKGNPELAMNLVEMTMKRVSNYFGLMNEHVLPAKWQSKLQRLTERYLGTCAEMWGMVLAMIQRRADPAELARIAGMEVPLSDDLAEIAGEYDVALFFDVKDLDMEFVWKKIEAFTKWVLPADKAGTVDYSKFVQLIASAIDPTWSQALVREGPAASQAIFNDTRNAIALMFQGNPPDLTEANPIAKTELDFANQIIYGDGNGAGGNPIYQQALKADGQSFNPVFAQHLQTWSENRMQSVKQDVNKETGRLGVNPMAGAMGPE